MGKKKKKKPKILEDKKGPYYFRTYFVGGKQKREKVRGFVLVDGEPVDTDDFLRENATDLDLHQMGCYELLYERECSRGNDDITVENDRESTDDDDELPF